MMLNLVCLIGILVCMNGSLTRAELKIASYSSMHKGSLTEMKKKRRLSPSRKLAILPGEDCSMYILPVNVANPFTFPYGGSGSGSTQIAASYKTFWKNAYEADCPIDWCIVDEPGCTTTYTGGNIAIGTLA